MFDPLRAVRLIQFGSTYPFGYVWHAAASSLPIGFGFEYSYQAIREAGWPAWSFDWLIHQLARIPGLARNISVVSKIQMRLKICTRRALTSGYSWSTGFFTVWKPILMLLLLFPRSYLEPLGSLPRILSASAFKASETRLHRPSSDSD